MPPSPNAAFGEVVRELRTQRGLSQEALSFACGRHRTYISLLERGHNSPSLDTLWVIAEALEVDASAILRDVERIVRAGGPARSSTGRGAGSRRG